MSMKITKSAFNLADLESTRQSQVGFFLGKELDQRLACSCTATQAGRGAACSCRRSSVSTRGLKGAIGNRARSGILIARGGAAL